MLWHAGNHLPLPFPGLIPTCLVNTTFVDTVVGIATATIRPETKSCTMHHRIALSWHVDCTGHCMAAVARKPC